MTKILLCCSAGMSTSTLVVKMQSAAKLQGIEIKVEAYGIAEAKNIISNWDIVLLGPQISYALDEVKASAGNIPVEVIPAAMYAMAKGAEVLNMVGKILKK